MKNEEKEQETMDTATAKLQPTFFTQQWLPRARNSNLIPTTTMTTTYKLNTISCSSRYPPQSYIPTKKDDRICTNCKNKILTVQASDVQDIPHHVIQQLHPDKPELQDKFIVVEDKPNSWILTVPLEINNNEVIYVKMFGDSGADCTVIATFMGCVKFESFKDENTWYFAILWWLQWTKTTELSSKNFFFVKH